MSRRSFCVAGGVLGLLLCVAVAAGLVLVRYEPRHYTEAPLSSEEGGSRCASEFYTEFTNLFNAIGGEKEWEGRFTDEQINSYLNEDFIHSGMSRLLPEGITEPRVVFEADRLRLAFRFRNSLVSTVISMDVRVWLAEGEPNVVALQLEGFRAGLLPISAQWLLEHLSEGCRQNGIEVNWYRHEGHPVALLRFQADQPRPTLLLQAVKIEQGVITIQGKSNDDSLHAQLTRPDGLLGLVTK